VFFDKVFLSSGCGHEDGWCFESAGLFGAYFMLSN